MPVLAAVVSWLAIDWDGEEASKSFPGGSVLRDASGGIMRVTLDAAGVDCRPFYTASPDDWIVRAIVASEDGKFWRHCGVRPGSVLRAAFQNVKAGGRRISGASTITMQTVRLIKPHGKSLFGKWVEAVKAMKMERRRDKIWILSQYLNRAPFGSNLIGVEAAARGWFGKGAKELGPGEAAMLAGLVQSPSRYRPDRAYAKAMKRRDYVLSRMAATGVLDEAGIREARRVAPEIAAMPRPFLHPHYCDFAIAEMKAASGGEMPRGDFTLPLDPAVQELCERTVSETAGSAPGISAAAVAVRVADGALLAMAVSGDYFSPDAGQVNTAAMPRSSGSTLKPFIAAMAIDRGAATPGRRLMDVPKTFSGYTPCDFDGRFRGLVTLRDALVQSLNVPFVSLLHETGEADFREKLRELGFSRMHRDDSSAGLGIAVGNAEVRLVELVRAFAAVARGGKTVEGRRVFSPESSYLVSEMLSGDERSTASIGHVAAVEAPKFAWKTGTSSAYRDAWTVAWNPEYALGVWAGRLKGGFNDRRVTGLAIAAPAVWKIVRGLYPGNVSPWFARPAGIGERKVCTLSGQPAGEQCPSSETDFFVKGASRAEPCGMHRIGADGKPETVLDSVYAAFSGRVAAARALAIAKPADGSKFEIQPGLAKQEIVFKPQGNPDGAELWWFDGGEPLGKSLGSEAFSAPLPPGIHRITCATAEGVSAAVTVETAAAGP